MSDKKPQVFPTQEQTAGTQPAPQQEQVQQPQVSSAEQAAAEEMKRRTEAQLRERDEALAKNNENAAKMLEEREAAMNRQTAPPVAPPPAPPVNYDYNQQPNYGDNNPMDSYRRQLNEPDWNSPYDVIPLPSEGKTYKTKKPSIKVSYLNTTDENILSSPNLLESGEFLEILFNRKILDSEIRYKDLLVGDRNAIMVWLRATAFGEMYPITLLDDKENMFETEFNLSELKTKNFGADPDQEGLFNYTMPLSKANIKFKFLNLGEIDEIEAIVTKEEEAGVPINNASTYRLQRQIVEVDGDRNPQTIKDFVNSLRIYDSKSFKEYADEIESGIDLNITVGTPGGGSINTFLPLNFKFFWPNL